jgi:hypothetical protein
MSNATVTPLRREAFLDCHADGHQWKHQPGVIDTIAAEPGMRAPYAAQNSRGRRSLCTSCGGERIRWYTPSGEVVNRYRMQEGYYHKRSAPDDYAPTRLEYRQQMVTTLFADLAPAAQRKIKAIARR